MNPDLDRLITAAEDAYQDARLPNEVLSQRTINAMVCAVLKELRGFSPAMEDALIRDRSVKRPMLASEQRGPLDHQIWIARLGYIAMLDAILAEPTAPR